jgi:hypothetical protein
MVYVALIFHRSETPDASNGIVANASYDQLERATGLSRKLVAEGLVQLKASMLVEPLGSNQQRTYRLRQSHRQFFKLPCRAIFKDGVIVPFKSFNKRAKHELHAMKIYLYLATARNGSSIYAVSSYEKITDWTGVPKNDIKRAINHLVNAGLVTDISREESSAEKYGPNRYKLAGANDLSAGIARPLPVA